MQPDDNILYPSARGHHDGLPHYGHLIGNEWVGSASNLLPVKAPATGRPLAWLAAGGSPRLTLRWQPPAARWTVPGVA